MYMHVAINGRVKKRMLFIGILSIIFLRHNIIYIDIYFYPNLHLPLMNFCVCVCVLSMMGFLDGNTFLRKPHNMWFCNRCDATYPPAKCTVA